MDRTLQLFFRISRPSVLIRTKILKSTRVRPLDYSDSSGQACGSQPCQDIPIAVRAQALLAPVTYFWALTREPACHLASDLHNHM